MNFKSMIATLALLAFASSCSVSSDDAASAADDAADVISANLSISGALDNSILSSKVGTAAVSAFTDIELYGLAFSNPPEASTVDVGSDGSFSIEFSNNAAGATISLIFRDKNDSSNEVGVVKFQDNDDVDMDGNPKTSSSISLNGTVSLGTLEVNEDGEVIVDVSQIEEQVQETTVSTSERTDFTGSWVFGSYTGDLPDGYGGLCPPRSENENEENNDSKCFGPSEGEGIYIKLIAGKRFTPSGTCATQDYDPETDGECEGTTGSEDKFGIAIWQSEETYQACGSKLGFSHDLAKAKGRVDFTGDTSITEGAFDYASGLEDGWKDTENATSDWEQRNCRSAQVTLNGQTQRGWRCTTSDGEYEDQLGGTCYLQGDSDQTNVHVAWDRVDHQNGSCTSEDLGSGFKRDSCTNPYDADNSSEGEQYEATLVCTHTRGVFDSDGSPDEDNSFRWEDVEVVLAENALCSSATNELAALRCYADHYWQNRDSVSGCMRDIRTNWEAETAEEFLVGNDGPAEAEGQHVMTIFDYTSNDSGTLTDSDTYAEGISSGQNSYTSCRINEEFKINITPSDSSTTYIVEFETKSRLVDSKEACRLAAEEEGSRLSESLSAMKFLSTMTKQTN